MNYGRPQRIYNDEVVGMFENKRNGALLALSQTFRNVKQFIRADMITNQSACWASLSMKVKVLSSLLRITIDILCMKENLQ